MLVYNDIVLRDCSFNRSNTFDSSCLLSGPFLSYDRSFIVFLAWLNFSHLELGSEFSCSLGQLSSRHSLGFLQLQAVLNLLKIFLEFALTLTFKVKTLKELIELVLTFVVEPAVADLSLNHRQGENLLIFLLRESRLDLLVGASVDHGGDGCFLSCLNGACWLSISIDFCGVFLDSQKLLDSFVILHLRIASGLLHDDVGSFLDAANGNLLFHTNVESGIVVFEVPVFALGSILAKNGRLDGGLVGLLVELTDLVVLLLDLIFERAHHVRIVILLAL